MSNRKDLETGRLIFTCNCGFVDTGHANPKGPKALWDTIVGEKSLSDNVVKWDHRGRVNCHHTIEGQPCFLIKYRQASGIGPIKLGYDAQYLIRRGLPVARKKEIALRIFMDVSLGYERLQASWPFRWITDSGFSVEDLVSNLISFHRAVDGHTWPEMLKQCGQVSTAAAQKVFDASFGKEGIGGHKITEFFKPELRPCDECKDQQKFPELLTRIVPAQLNTGDFIWLPPISPNFWLQRKSVDFTRDGREKH